MAEEDDRLKYANELAQALLRTLMLMHGGAIVALLAFIGREGAIYSRDTIWNAFAWFGGGLVAVPIAMMLGYFTHNFVRVDQERRAMVSELLAILVVLISIIAFIAGAYFGLTAILP